MFLVVMRVYIYIQSLTDFSRLWQSSVKLSRSRLSQQNSAEFCQASILLKYSFWQNLAEVNQVSRIQQNSIELAELGRTLLSSVSPRYSYCNLASPVTIPLNWYINIFRFNSKYTVLGRIIYIAALRLQYLNYKKLIKLFITTLGYLVILR